MDPRMWTIYDVSWTFLTQICGSVPADPEIVTPWLEARRPRVDRPAASPSTRSRRKCSTLARR